ncbi:MAG: hypothetical protein ACXWW0_06540 [Bacteroidia bacterium]
MKIIEQFFRDYASVSTNGNAEELAKFYAQNFMVATKDLSSSFNNDEEFIDWLNGVFEFNKNAGLQKLEVKKVESHHIGNCFFEASVTWATFFAKKPNEEITFDIHYILHNSHDELKIILYISEEDQEELMKKKGLL